MNWNEIEFKWAAMARRVRADLPELPQEGRDEDPRDPPTGDLPRPPPRQAEKVSAE